MLLWDNHVSSLWGKLSVPSEFLGHYFQKAKYWKGTLQPLHRPVWLTDCGIISMKHKNGSLLLVGNSRRSPATERDEKKYAHQRAQWRPLPPPPEVPKDEIGWEKKTSPTCHLSSCKCWFSLHMKTVASCCVTSPDLTNLPHTRTHTHSHFAFLVLAEKYCASRRPKNQTTTSVLTALSFANFGHSQPPKPLLSHLKICTCLEFDSLFSLK